MEDDSGRSIEEMGGGERGSDLGRQVQGDFLDLDDSEVVVGKRRNGEIRIDRGAR